MKILEARFHPQSKHGSIVVTVGRVVCDGKRASIVPFAVHAPMVRPFDSDGLITKLQFLVDSSIPEPYDRLTTLRSDFWSFVDVNAQN
jgi:hypothetical protein